MTGRRPDEISTGAADVLSAMLEARTGQSLAANRRWRLQTELRGVMADLGVDSLDLLVARILQSRDPVLADRVIDALMNRETSFFRDSGVMEAAAAAVSTVGERSGAERRPRPRVWCAACSTGQEPLSLAMALSELDAPMPEILATDLSASAIARARAGTYTQFEIQRGLPIRQMVRWFENPADDQWTALPSLLRAITYRRHNLVSDPVPPGGFDLIMCRNVLFYLAPSWRTIVLDRLSRALRPGGLLLLGAGETVIGQCDRLRPSVAARGFYESVEMSCDDRQIATGG